MAKQTITTKYGTRIDVTGLSPEQIKRVRSVAEDKGAYGSKGAALAKELQSRIAAPAAQTPTPPAPTPTGAATTAAPSTTTTEAAAAAATKAESAGKNYITTKYGTKIDVTGLTPEQVKRVRSVAEDKGAYGAKGAALAQEMRKKNETKAGTGNEGAVTTPPQPEVPIVSKVQPVDLGVQPGTGLIDPNKAGPTLTGAEDMDARRNFDMNNPGEQIDALGNKKIVERDPITGEVTTRIETGELANSAKGILGGALENLGVKGNMDISGAPKILETGDVRTEAQKVGDANYAYLTRNVGRDKRREMEATKQELAERGIPIDYGNADSMWNKATGAINQRYDEIDAAANQQSIMGRDASMGALISGQNIARDAFLKGVNLEAENARANLNSALTATGSLTGEFSPYAGGSVDQSGVLQGLFSKMSDAELAKYGIDKDYAAKIRAINKSGSGGGGDAGGGFAIGGVAP